MTSQLDYDFSSKLILLGCANIGKRSFVCRYIDNTFFDISDPVNSIGVDFKVKKIEKNNLICRQIV